MSLVVLFFSSYYPFSPVGEGWFLGVSPQRIDSDLPGIEKVPARFVPTV